MPRSRTVGRTRRLLVTAGVGLTSVSLFAACGSGAGDGSVTLPPGVSAGPGDVTLPDDVAVTRPPERDPIEPTVPADPIEAAPADPVPEDPNPDPVTPVDPVPEDPVPDTVVDEAGTGVDDDTTDDMVWWPWVLGVLAVVVVIVGVTVARSRRSGSQWTASALAMIDASDALTSHLLALAPEGLAVVARDDAQRLADLDATTQDLVRTAPDDRRRGAIDGVRGPLVQLHAAVNMVSLSPKPTTEQQTLVHQWANALHVATSTARSTLTTPSP